MNNREYIVLAVDTILNQRYTIKKVLNSSDCAVIYLATDCTLGIPVVIKEYYPSDSCSRVKEELTIIDKDTFLKGKENFLLETRILMKFEQDGIVHCYNCFEENNTAYRVMEYLEGDTLQEYLKQYGKVTISKAKDIATKMMDALIQIHQSGYVNLDVAPDNIIICNDDKVKLIDVSNASESNIKSVNLIYKTEYQPLEQYKKRAIVTPSSDVYSLGATIYHMLTGIVPYPADKRSHLTEKYHRDVLEKLSYFDDTIPTSMEQAIMKSLSIEKNNRFQTVQEFKDVFMGYKKLEPTLSQKQYLDRTKKIAFSLIGVGCVVIVGLLLYIYF